MTEVTQDDDGPLGIFEAHRARLFGLAYRLLGEAAEAEDVLQDAYLRWSAAAAQGSVEVPGAWLTKAVTNLCLTRLTSARARREQYVGPWLPEPVFTGTGGPGTGTGTGGTVPGPLETAEQRDSVSMGVLVLLERLTPAERAAFVLREAFGHRHAEIADVLGISEAHSRQLHRRAREHVRRPGRRFEADPERRAEVVRRFMAAALEGDVEALERTLAEDVTAWSDGGGKVTAARHPVTGRSQVARLLAGIGTHPRGAGADVTLREVNGEPAIVVHLDGALYLVMFPEVEDGRVTAVRSVLNPEKLAHAARHSM
ncbi:RNA polymerase sigma factor SigJ [Streptomyces sp. NPDC048172]|uniref:RNA polymerase sigma factor SigJ n=1 Tax=Streptomyces sp. NPDC048172 TaxID=3365505 RepID=UPI0037200239